MTATTTTPASPSLEEVALLRRLAESDAHQRQLALIELEDVASPHAVPSLIAAVTDPDETVRRLAVGLLELLGDGRAAPALIGALGDEAPAVRDAAHLALRELRD
ncbi:MAG: HEAT repeat domain-containing protein, partial [Pseudomonadota bacterium]